MPAGAGPQASAELVRALATAAREPATLRAYAADWRAFAKWAKDRGIPSLPASPGAVAAYLAELAAAGKAYATIARALASISVVHVQTGHGPSPRADPLVRDVVRGIARTLGIASTRAKAAFSVAELRAMIVGLDHERHPLAAVRDRAILVAGFAGAFRRSELAALDAGDLTFDSDGAKVNLRRSKTDPEGRGRLVGLPFGSDAFTCPVRALKGWLDASGIKEGAVFVALDQNGARGPRLSPRAVGEIVKRAAKRIGLDPAKYAGHSLRAGLCTSAARAGKSAAAIMAQTGHRSAAMVLRYVRAGTLFDDNAASGIGL